MVCGHRFIVKTALSGKESLFPDKVHPNDEGTELIAQTVAAALEQVVSSGLLATTVASN
jgi:lysophospholipase L1-like esterase